MKSYSHKGKGWQSAVFPECEPNFKTWNSLNNRGNLFDRRDFLKAKVTTLIKFFKKLIKKEKSQLAVHLNW